MLSNVHDALSKAVIESKKPPKLDKTFTFRTDLEQMIIAEGICDANGTTVSMFLRKCIDCLVEDYRKSE